MKEKIASIIVILLGLVGLVQAQSTLEITIKNIASGDGQIRVALFSNEQGFLKAAVKTQEVKVSGNEAVCVFGDIEEGDYAVSAFHDLNNNSILDMNWVGMPTEPYVFSNDVRGTFGPPSFSNARFCRCKRS